MLTYWQSEFAGSLSSVHGGALTPSISSAGSRAPEDAARAAAALVADPGKLQRDKKKQVCKLVLYNIYICIHVCIYIYIHIHIHIHICIYTYIHTVIHSYIHTFIHSYTFIHSCIY